MIMIMIIIMILIPMTMTMMDSMIIYIGANVLVGANVRGG